MNALTQFGKFLWDFVVGDSIEVAATIVITVAVLWILISQVGGADFLGFVLIAVVFAVTWFALMRTTRDKRR